MRFQAVSLFGGVPFRLAQPERDSAGCIVSCTTASNCPRNCSRSTSLRSVALKAASVFSASYFWR